MEGTYQGQMLAMSVCKPLHFESSHALYHGLRTSYLKMQMHSFHMYRGPPMCMGTMVYSLAQVCKLCLEMMQHFQVRHRVYVDEYSITTTTCKTFLRKKPKHI